MLCPLVWHCFLLQIFTEETSIPLLTPGDKSYSVSTPTHCLSLESQMEMAQPAKRIHPLVAGAAVSVTLVSLLGAAAITGILPSSHGTAAPTTAMAAQPVAATPAPAALTSPPVQTAALQQAAPA